MSNTNFATLVADKQNFTVAQKTKLFIGTPYDLGAAIPYETMTLATGAVAANATSITVTAGTPVDLYEGTILAFKADWTNVAFDDSFTDFFVVSAFTAAGATSIPIEATPETAAGDEEIRVFSHIPFFSANTANIDNQTTIISDNVFSDGLYQEKAVTDVSSMLDTSGPWIYDDPGYVALDAVRGEGKFVVVTAVFAGLRGGRTGVAVIGQSGISANRGEFMSNTQNFEFSGKDISLKAQAA